MKKAIMIFCTGMLLLATSCENWLDVKPKAEIKWDVMFETEQGFKDALIGCYYNLADESVYGGALNCTFIEVLAQQYTLSSYTNFTSVAQYLYQSTAVTSYSDAIWSKLYKVLANVNALIEATEVKGEVMHPTMRALVEAETRSLRAYIYLDLLRMFTWGNLADRPDRADKLNGLAIPYADTYDKNIIPQAELKTVLQKIHEDLDAAVELFLGYAPESKIAVRPEGYTPYPGDDNFFDEKEKTKYRMNLRGAIATRMRLNMWEGNYDEAYEDAMTLQSSDYPLQWVAQTDLQEGTSQALVLSKEMLFGLKAYDRFEQIWKPYFKRMDENDNNQNTNFLGISEEHAHEIYEREAGFADADWRYIYWLAEKNDPVFRLNKYYETEDMTNTNNITLLKSAEVCYTEAECLLRKGGGANKVKAVEALNKVRKNRGLASMLLETSLPEEEVWNELEKEWRKEFIGDGQLFFYYKRMGVTSIPYTTATCDDKVYVLPLPQAEVDFGGSTDLIERK